MEEVAGSLLEVEDVVEAVNCSLSTTIVTKNSHPWYLHWVHTRLALSTVSHEGGRGLWGSYPSLLNYWLR